MRPSETPSASTIASAFAFALAMASSRAVSAHRVLVVIGEDHVAALVDAEADGAVENGAEPVEIADAHGQGVVDAVAGDPRLLGGAVLVLRIDPARLDREGAGLQIALGDAFFLHRGQHRGHRLVVGVGAPARAVSASRNTVSATTAMSGAMAATPSPDTETIPGAGVVASWAEADGAADSNMAASAAASTIRLPVVGES